MDSMKELEKRWYYYKAKQSLLSLNAGAFVLMLSLGGYYGYLKSEVIMGLFNENRLIAETKTPNVAETPKKDIVIASKNEGLDSSLYEVSLEPVIPIVNMEQESKKIENKKIKNKKRVVSKRTYKTKKHSAKHQGKMVKAKASTYLTASELSGIREKVSVENRELNTEKIKKINLNGSSVNYIETMKKKFSMGKNPRDALLLAKAFYAKGQYGQSEKWALTANKLDSSKDESWHIFAKSKLKLGQKNEALKILSSYYKKSHSAKTKALMIKIKTERL